MSDLQQTKSLYNNYAVTKRLFIKRTLNAAKWNFNCNEAIVDLLIHVVNINLKLIILQTSFQL